MQQNVTAPAFEQPQTEPPVNAPVSKRVHRVGTLTMGLSLIAFGIFSIIALFCENPLTKFSVLLKFAPVILILLGIELVCSAVFFKNDKLKFDWLSVIISFILIIVSLGASFVSILPEIGLSTKNRIETENAVYNDIFAKTTKISDINSVSVNIHSNNYYESPQSINDITPADIIFIDFNLNSTTKDDFCKTAAEICTRLKGCAYFNNAFRVDFTASGTNDNGEDFSFFLHLTPNFSDFSVNSLADMCEVYIYNEQENDYIDEVYDDEYEEANIPDAEIIDDGCIENDSQSFDDDNSAENSIVLDA